MLSRRDEKKKKKSLGLNVKELQTNDLGAELVFSCCSVVARGSECLIALGYA